MTLSCRFVRKPRKTRTCADCGGAITADAMRIFGGSPDVFPQPQMFWYHIGCICKHAWHNSERKVNEEVKRITDRSEVAPT